ncbi:MAG TPA: hypothetical protein VF928_00110 [Usitatibacteraceae bacterium]
MPQSGNIQRSNNDAQPGEAENLGALTPADTGKRSRSPAETFIIALLLIICCFAFASSLLR